MASVKKTSIFLLVPLILVLSLIIDALLGFAVFKFDLQQFTNGNNLFVLPFVPALFAAVIAYFLLKRKTKDKIIISIVLFILTYLIAYSIVPVIGALFALSDACARQAPLPCLL